MRERIMPMGGAMYRVASLLCVFFCAGCASSASDIQPQYVSDLQYQHLSCKQIGGEAERISPRVAEISGVQDEKASSDAVATGVALVIFWPAAFFIKGDGATAAELGRLKGEFEALERVSIRKNCGLQFRRPPSTAEATKAGRKKAEEALMPNQIAPGACESRPPRLLYLSGGRLARDQRL